MGESEVTLGLPIPLSSIDVKGREQGVESDQLLDIGIMVALMTGWSLLATCSDFYYAVFWFCFR